MDQATLASAGTSSDAVGMYGDREGLQPSMMDACSYIDEIRCVR